MLKSCFQFFRQTQMTPAAVTIFRSLRLFCEISLHTKMFHYVGEKIFLNPFTTKFFSPWAHLKRKIYI